MAGGRPTDYDADEHPKVARQLTGMGRTLADLAEAVGVARSTVQNWMDQHPEFLVAIKLGREDACDRVERALLERAIGYSHPSEKIVVVSGGQGMGSSVERVAITEHYPPDTAAASLFLRNRRSSEWKERQEVSHDLTDRLAERLEAAQKRASAGEQQQP